MGVSKNDPVRFSLHSRRVNSSATNGLLVDPFVQNLSADRVIATLAGASAPVFFGDLDLSICSSTHHPLNTVVILTAVFEER